MRPGARVELEPSDIRARIRARLIELAEERTPRFFKDGDGQFAVCPEPDPEGERWIRVERPGCATRYRLDPRGRIGAIERVERERQSLTVIEEYARATPGRVLPASAGSTRATSGRARASDASAFLSPTAGWISVAAGRLGDRRRVRERVARSACGAVRPPAALIPIALSAP